MTVNEIYERAAPGVVQIARTSSSSDVLSGTAPSALGSGFVVDKAGHIVTNFHVVEDADEIRVSFSNRDTVEAELVASDPSTDLAVLRVDAEAKALTPLPLGDSDDVRVGDPVVAIGNPFGLDRTATAGIVSALQRLITAPNDFAIDHVIQTDAPINHGNSGGPLLNAHGEVIGVNTQIQTGGVSTGNVGIGFAVPSNTVEDVVAQILQTGYVEHAYLGIAGRPVTEDFAETYNLPVERGVLVEVVRLHGRGEGGSRGRLDRGRRRGSNVRARRGHHRRGRREAGLLHRRAARRDRHTSRGTRSSSGSTATRRRRPSRSRSGSNPRPPARQCRSEPARAASDRRGTESGRCAPAPL